MPDRKPDRKEDTLPTSTSPPWWRNAVIYEVYPRSFADGNGDGEGDVPGLTSRLPYLADLGVDALWIAPWYPSPLADGGYDITDYRGIHPTFGTIQDADVMLAAAHRLGIRVIVDLVANHTSHQHPWFQAAIAGGAGSRERGWYLFRDGRGKEGELPPNNWISAFGGSGWTRVAEPDGTPGQWYLHTFAPEQPDLNWESPDVLDEFDGILRYWLDRGVDGFRVDAVPAMAKQPGLPDAEYDADLRFASADWVDNPHWDVDAVHGILRRWRRLLDTYPGERLFVAEAVVNGPERAARYVRPDELHTAFNFDYMHAAWDTAELREAIGGTLAALQPVGAPATWVMSSHDEVRHVTRLGRPGIAGPPDSPGNAAADLDLGTRRARAAILLTLSLPGGVYLYQGEELGLPEVEDLPDDVVQDPVQIRSRGRRRGRDGCRVPLPWDGDRPPFGFSAPGTRTWLPQPPSWSCLTVSAQAGRRGSMLQHYQEALRLRRRLAHLLDDDLTWLPAPGDVLAFARGDRFRCVVNLGAHGYPLDATPAITSVPLAPGNVLPSDAAAWIVGS